MLPDERLSRRRVAALGTGFAEVFVVLGAWTGLAGHDLPGALMALGGGLCYGIGFPSAWRALDVRLHLADIAVDRGDCGPSSAMPPLKHALALADEPRMRLRRARDIGDRYWQAWVLHQLGVLHRLTGDYQAAVASHQVALQTVCEIGDPPAQGEVRKALGLAQQLTGDNQAAAASHQQALRLMRNAGERYGQARVLNCLGELASRTSATVRARDHHSEALAIARQIGVPLEEARALQGIGQSHLRDGNPAAAAPQLRHALTIYERLGTPGAQRVEETLRRHGL